MLAVSFGAVSLAHAQGAALEEVVITAQKRKENLQDVPISVQALDAKALEKSGVVTLSDVKAFVPGLTIDNYPGSSEMLYPSIRGIVPNSVEISVPIPMAIHLDGVALTQLAGLNLAGADLERIEVLKGPQGVLAGRNATGGAINIVTVKPELGQFGFKQQFTIAERGQFLSKTIVNAPITDNFAAKLSYLYSTRDNLGVANIAPGGSELGKKDADSLRLDLRWRASANVMVDYGFDRAQSKSIDLPNQCMVPFGYTSFLPYLATVDSRMASVTKGCSMDKFSQLNVPFRMPKNNNIAEGHNLTVNWEIDPKLTFRSITGYRKVDTKNNVLYVGFGPGSDPYFIRSDGMPMTFLGGPTPFDGQAHQWIVYNESWSQEFQLLGDLNQNIKYTTGLYYATEKGHQRQGPGIFFTVPDAMFLGGAGPVGVDMATLEYRKLEAKNSTWAVFGQMTWTPDFLDRKLEIVPGVRYTKDHRRATGTNLRGEQYFYTATGTPGVNNLLFSVPNPLAYSNVSGDNTFSKVTPALSLGYHWNKDLMTYVKASKGYVTGGFDDQQQTAAGFAKGFKPETITSYELGMKGEFLDRRLRLNGALFDSKYDNEQKTVVHAGNVWAIENVGVSKYKGAELDATALLTDNFRVSMAASWLDHKYAKWIDQDTSSPTYGQDVANNRKLVVPKLSYVVNLDYRFPDFGLPGKLDLNVNYSYRDPQSTPIDLTVPASRLYVTTPKFDLINARLALSQIKVGPDNKARLTVALWGKNLADKKYHTFDGLTTSADKNGVWGEPRTYGLDLIYNY
jgi:iron complex outermembrane receptor protein